MKHRYRNMIHRTIIKISVIAKLFPAYFDDQFAPVFPPCLDLLRLYTFEKLVAHSEGYVVARRSFVLGPVKNGELAMS